MSWKIKPNFFRYMAESYGITKKRMRNGVQLDPNTWYRLINEKFVSETTVLKLIFFLRTQISPAAIEKIKHKFLELHKINEEQKKGNAIRERLHKGFLERKWTLKKIGEFSDLPPHSIRRFTNKQIGLEKKYLDRVNTSMDIIEKNSKG